MRYTPKPTPDLVGKMQDAAQLLAEISRAYGGGRHQEWSSFELRVTAQLLEAGRARVVNS